MNQKFSLLLLFFIFFITFLLAQEIGSDDDFDTLLHEKAKRDSIILSRTSSSITKDNYVNSSKQVNYNNPYNPDDSMQKNWPLLVLLIIAFILVVVLLIIQFNLRKKMTNIHIMQDKKSQHKTRLLLRSVEEQKQDLIRLRKMENAYQSLQDTQDQLMEKVEKTELLQKAIEAMKYPVAITDLYGVIIFYNQEFAEMHDYDIHELLKSNISVLFPDTAKIANTINNKQIWEDQILNVVTLRKNGTENNLYSKSTLLLDADNKPRSILTTYDLVPKVIEQDKTEELEKSYQEKQRIFENIQDVYYEVDIDGRINDISPSISDISNDTREELIGRNMKILFADEEQREKFINALKKEHDLNDYEINLKGKNNSIIPCIITAKLLLDENNMPSLIVGSIQNITKRKQEESKRKKIFEDLKVMNKDLLDFAYITSHDLKSPLRAINTLANWVMMDEENKMSEESQNQMQLLINRTERMHNLIDAIFDYTNIVSFDGEKSNIDMAKMFTGLQSRMNIPQNITVKIKEEIPNIVFEKTRIEQIFENLIDNSLKFMDKDRGIIFIDWTERSNEYEFSVTDNGPGIDAKYFEKVFQIFQTLKARDEVEGIGIGMAIVKKIITKYGGKIWLNSKLGAGLTVSFTIPKLKK